MIKNIERTYQLSRFIIIFIVLIVNQSYGCYYRFAMLLVPVSVVR